MKLNEIIFKGECVMKDKKAESLKKRTFADMICSFVIATVSLFVFIIKLWVYFSAGKTYPGHIIYGLYALFVFAFTIITGLILLEVSKIGRPFSKKIINKLRVLAILVIAAGLLPDSAAIVIHNTFNPAAKVGFEFVFSTKNLIISVVGVIIGIISEIFVYGYELQDDIDLIA
jgi:hypothetical protein